VFSSRNAYTLTIVTYPVTSNTRATMSSNPVVDLEGRVFTFAVFTEWSLPQYPASRLVRIQQWRGLKSIFSI